ncbi:MAG: metallophosphoesterase [Clostridia bacterium]
MVYGISDLHLSFGCNKPMNIFGKVWIDYEKKIAKNWIEKVKEDDYVIIAGDISWSTYLTDAIKDFEFINKLPGKKIILKGNHDYYFDTVSKLESFFKDNNFNNFIILNNNAIEIDNYILCGSRGWGITEKEYDDQKLICRERIRLELSLKEGIKLQKNTNKDILVAMHFPPFEFSDILEKYNVKKCVYGHLHGYGHKNIREGIINNIEYVMISCDYTNFDLIQL